MTTMREEPPPNLYKATKKQLIAEVERLWACEAISEETNELFDKWTDDFFRLHKLDHLIEQYHEYILDCLEREDEE